MARQEGGAEGACSDEGAVRELWLQPCADGELGAALYSNAAFAALKCTDSRNQDHVCIAAVVRPRPRHSLAKELGSLVRCALAGPCIVRYGSCVLSAEAARQGTLLAVCLCHQPCSCRFQLVVRTCSLLCQPQYNWCSSGRPRCARCGSCCSGATMPACTRAASCARRRGELVHMKARLRALEAFERLGNWGQVRPGRLCK